MIYNGFDYNGGPVTPTAVTVADFAVTVTPAMQTVLLGVAASFTVNMARTGKCGGATRNSNTITPAVSQPGK